MMKNISCCSCFNVLVNVSQTLKQHNVLHHSVKAKKVQVFNDREKAQSERESLSKNRGGKNIDLNNKHL